MGSGSSPRYDTFTSYKSSDAAFAEQLAARMEDEAGLRVFLDRWHLVRGEPVQEALEGALNDSKTCVVLIGPTGTGPWENEEFRAALEMRVRRTDFHVVPVLLPGATKKIRDAVPPLLRRLSWVDFADGDPDEEFRALVAAIKREAPGRPRRPAWALRVPVDGLAEPTGIAIGGRVYFVADHHNGTVTKVSQDGACEVIVEGLSRPHHLATMGDRLLIADTYADRIVMTTFSGEQVAQWKAFGRFHLRRPHAVASNTSHSFFVLSSDTHALLKIDAGRLSKVIRNPRGVANTAPAYFSTPCGLGLSATAVFVADTFNHRVQVFDHDLGALAVFGEFGYDTAQFAYPVGIAVWHEWVVVADEHNQRLQLWRTLATDSGVDAIPLVDDLMSDVIRQPFGVVFSRAGRMFVTDRSGAQVFSVDFERMLAAHGV